MPYMVGASGAGLQPIVHINAVDTINRRASGMWSDGSDCDNIDTSYSIGAVQVTPAIGEQWMVEAVGNGNWRLVALMPIHVASLSGQTTPSPGQTQIGGQGPTEILGSTINVYSWIRLHAPETRPSAATAGAGAMIWDADLGKPIFSNGTVWVDAVGSPLS